MNYKDDLRYQAAMDDYLLDDFPAVSAMQQLARRFAAINIMHAIEKEYELREDAA